MNTFRRTLFAARLQSAVAFERELDGARQMLYVALDSRNARISPDAPTDTLLRVARALSQSDAAMRRRMETFEDTVGPSLLTYIALAPRRDGAAVITADAQAIRAHLRDYADMPLDPGFIERMLTSALHIFRAWRKGSR